MAAKDAWSGWRTWRGLALLVIALSCTAAGAADLAFRRHELNANSAFPSCAVFDVNRDGKADIVCGGFWYEAPTWQRHFLRDVEVIRGRYDDYSNLPLEVNGDGFVDLVSANYRSRKLYWIEHPGKSLGAWTAHVVDTPGPMETARLADIDGDGRLDVLPNAVESPAWWEVVLNKAADRKAKPAPRWVKHDLPKELAGHGLGFGDINGDGRGDLVGPRGWLEAPADRRTGRWLWHADFELHRDASVPILVLDVDGDGDNDLVYSRAHNIGLYWMEQVRPAKKSTAQKSTAQTPGFSEKPGVWVRHAIDTSHSQAHSLLVADLDNDRRPEVIAGSRHLAHDGRDPGEYDPPAIYAYTFQGETRTWRRQLISAGGRAYFGLDPKAADVDGDGDLDLVAADRTGLFWFENLTIKGDKALATNRPPAVPSYPDHSKLMIVKDDPAAGADGPARPVKTLFDGGLRRAHILGNVERVMGELPGPEVRVPLDVRVLKEERTEHYVRQSITFAAEPGDRVPAYLLIPHNLTGRAPAMLCLHQTTRIGKGEPAGLGGLKNLHYAHELAQRGYVCLAPDYPSFGDYDFNFTAPGRLPSGSMKAIWNNLRAVDLLESLPQVDPDRIGCIGHSLGGHNTIFTAAFDQRIKAMVSSCGFTAFHHYYKGNLAGWTSDRYMPRIRTAYGNDPSKVPFDFYELVAALAPRPFFVNAPVSDGNFEVGGVKKVVAAAQAVYDLRGAKQALKAVYPEVGHDFPEDVRGQAYAFLDQALKRE
jgi:dienelactone hydrolase